MRRASSIHPLESDAPVIVYLDVKSPYAYLAIEPTRQLERDTGRRFDWRPFVLDIPSYLGSARLGDQDQVLEQHRSDEQWAAVKYAYFDCRRYARLQGKTIRGTVKIWDTHLVSTAMLWLREFHPDRLPKFIDRVFAPFWVRELDLEREDIISNLLEEAGLRGGDFLSWASTEGMQINTDFQQSAFELGIFGVPTFVVGGELLFGREHLPRVRWHLAGCPGSSPDIAYSAPDVPSPSLHKPVAPPSRVVVGVDDSLDSLLGLPPLHALLNGFAGDVQWTQLPPKIWLQAPTTRDDSRSALHKQLRLRNARENMRRYVLPELLKSDEHEISATGIPRGIDAAVRRALAHFFRSRALTLQSLVPEPSLNPPLPGMVVALDEELFVGRQHLPLIERRLRGTGRW